jgi:phosphatidylserine decarboxylase
MSTTELPGTEKTRPAPLPPPPEIAGAQPGGGVCYQIEMAWGRWRRWWLKRFRPGYVRRMAQLRHGDVEGAPHEILDPRDLKYCRNVVNCSWDEADDPFRWRERLPFARWGLAELQVIGGPLLAATVAFGLLAVCVSLWFWPLAVLAAIPLGLVVWFFRDPPRRIPQEPGLLVSPADGKVVEISPIEHDEYLGGPAVRIGIFLSIFNVHINRAPCGSRVMALRYAPGEFLSALNPESSRRNESMWIGLEEEAIPHRRMILRVISGAVARRIVCPLRAGEVLARGQKFGMIKLGSRTELILPDGSDWKIEVRVGDRVKAGTSVVARLQEAT